MKLIIIPLLPLFSVFPQQNLESELDSAFFNMKKGIYWALSNIDSERSRLDKELISDNKLFSEVKLQKEVDGVKIESRGIYNSIEVSVILYRSDSFLESEGYLKRSVQEESPKKKKKK